MPPDALPTIEKIDEILGKIRDVNVIPEEIRDTLRGTVAEIRSKLSGAIDKDHLLIDQSLQIRDEALNGIDRRVDRFRLLASAEIAFQQLGLAEESDPHVDTNAMKEAVDQFVKVREQRRGEITAKLGEVADVVIELQRTLDHAFEQERVVAITHAADSNQAFDRVCRLINQTAGRDNACDMEKVKKYLLLGQENALLELAEDLKEDTFREEIVELLRHARLMFESVSKVGSARFLHLGSIFMKAATATKIEGLPKNGWYKDVIEHAKAANGGKGGTVDLNTDTGVRFVFHVDAAGGRTALLKDMPKQYGDTSTTPAAKLEEILMGEQDHANRQYPNSSPIYAHLYEEGEICEAFEAMHQGARCSCVVLGEAGAVSVTLEKRDTSFVYVGEVNDVPNPDDVYKNPGLKMLPWSLRFLINGSHDRTPEA